MRFTVSQTALQKALSVVIKGTAASSTLPILTGIKITAGEGTLEFQATDLDISLKHRIPANVEDGGTTVVSGKMIAGIVKSLPDAPVTFDSEGNSVRLSCQRSKFNLNTLDPTDFPEFPAVEAERSVELPAGVLATMVDRVYRVVSRDLSKPILGGIYLTVDENLVRLVATDSYRLAVCDTTLETSTLTEPFSMIVTGSAFHDALSIADADAPVLIGAAASQAVFSFGDTVYVSRRIEGTFPDYRQLLPKSCSTSLELPVEEASEGLRRVSLVAAQNPRVRFDIDADGDLVTMSAMDSDVGDASEQVEVPVEGSSVAIGLNHRYVSDCLSAVSDREKVLLELQGEMQPAVFKSFGTPNYLQLIMPTRL